MNVSESCAARSAQMLLITSSPNKVLACNSILNSGADTKPLNPVNSHKEDI